MKFFIGFCLFAVVATSLGYRVARDTTSHEDVKLWTDEQEKEALTIATQYCKNVSGVEDGVTQIFHGVEKFLDCTFKIFDPKEVQGKFETLKGEDSPEDTVTSDMFKEICPKTNEVFHCFDDFKTLLPYCLDHEDMDAINLVVRLVKRVIDFACHNDGEHVIKFIQDGGVDCFEEHNEEFATCYSDAKEKYAKKVQHEFEKEDKDFEFKVTKDDCDEYDHQNHCLVDMMKSKCTKKTISEIAHDFFVAIKGELHCDALQNVV